MNTTTLTLAQVVRLVDEDDLVCAGCHEHVRAERPTAVLDVDPAGAEFSHRDGSALCADRRGWVCGPNEVDR